MSNDPKKKAIPWDLSKPPSSGPAKDEPPPNPAKIYLDRSNKQVNTETDWGKFNVLSSDYMGKKFMKGEHYENEKIAKVLPLINEGDTVLDVGANFGIHTIPYAKQVGKEGVVYAFEPQGVIYNLLCDNVQYNVPDYDVRTFHQAIGHRVMDTTMSGYCDGKPIDYHRSQQTNYGGLSLGKEGEQVKMITVDSLGLNRLDYLKIDVEGAENLVIYGAKKTIDEFRPIIFYEQNWKKITKEMIDMYDLSKNIVNFDIHDYLKKEMHYSDIQKIGSNFLAIP